MIQFAVQLYQNTYRYHNGTSLVLSWFSMFLFMFRPSQQNCFNMASGGISVLHQVLCEYMILCHKPKHCLEGGFWRI